MVTQRDVESFKDFCQYYGHRYWRSASVPNRMYWLYGTAAGGGAAMVNIYEDGKAVAEAKVLSSDEIYKDAQFGVPLVGMTEFNSELLYIYYRTSRTGHRGFGGERTAYHSFNGNLLVNYGLKAMHQGVKTDPKFAHQALFPKHTPLVEAYDDLTSENPKKLAYPLSYKWGVYLSDTNVNPILCYKTHKIGELIGRTQARIKPYYREFADIAKRVLSRDLTVEFK